MAHYNGYDSFQTKKSREKKNRTKQRLSNKKNNINQDFIIVTSNDYCTVIEVKYNIVYVLFNNRVVEASLRKDMNVVCNQILFPGDHVIVKNINGEYIITNMITRCSLLSRVKKDGTRLDDSIGLTKNVAANIEVAVIVVAAKQPPLHERFIDRYLMILKNSGIEAIICLNKCDIMTDEIKRLNAYVNIGIPFIETSTYQKKGIDKLKSYIRGKQAIFVGNSGVGKSSLINAIMDSDEVKTNTVGSKSKRGRHTTTASKYYIWDKNSSIIDTPGIRSLDISSFETTEIQDYFPEFDDWKKLCKFNNCIHFNEPFDFCFVKQGVANGMIDRNRYNSYIRIIESLENMTFPNDFQINN